MPHPAKYKVPSRRAHWHWSQFEIESHLPATRIWRISSDPSIDIIIQVSAISAGGVAC